MKKNILFIFLIALVVCLPFAQSYAAVSPDAPKIFQELSLKIGVVGSGFLKVGMVITGFGLISFAVAAMFNKISWKTFAYIAISAATLSATTGILAYMGEGDGVASLTFTEGVAQTSSSGTTVPISRGGYY